MPKNMSLAEWGKRSSDNYNAFAAIPGCKQWSFQARGSRKNDIIRAVNSKMSAKDAGLNDKFEVAYFEYLWKEAQLHQDAYGFWPTFDMCEIESDDPVLDRYSEQDSAENWVKDRKAGK